MKFVDFFAGIGGIRLGLEQAGHKCVGFVEFDKYARKSYEAMYNTEGEWTASDIRAVEPLSIPRADLWCFGFPCQDISAAGKQAGIENGSRSNLFFEIIRLLAGQENKPQWLLCENVKHLLYIRRGFDFARVLLELGGQGYDCQWQLVNSKDYGVPQNRERVFIVGCHRAGGFREILPISPTDGKNPAELQEITHGVRRCKRLYDGSGLACTISAVGGGGEKKQAFIDLDEDAKVTENARTLTRHYNKHEVSNLKAERAGIVEFIDLNEGGRITQTVRTIQARYNKGYATHKGEMSGIIERLLT